MNQPNSLMFLTDDGVPQIVQKVRYRYGLAAWEITYFDGSERLLPAELCTPNIGLWAYPRGEEEYKDAAIYAAHLYQMEHNHPIQKPKNRLHVVG